MRVILIISFLFCGALIAQDLKPEKYALVIGVKAYQFVPPLQNSLNDAKDMSATLKTKGFKVIELYDPVNKRVMQDAVRRYFDMLREKPDAAGLVYYSGHGMQVKGLNYLVPTQANPQIEADLEDQCVKLDYLMQALQEAGNGLNIFILDACRNNPFRGFTRSGERGLSMVDAPKGSYIVYATKPGSVASDGTGRNGLFTSKLLQHINTTGLNIEQVFKQVARDVAAASNDEQRPWISSDYTGDFYFTPGSAVKENPSVSPSDKITPNPAVLSRGKSEMPLSNEPPDFGYGPGTSPVVTIGSQVWSATNLNVNRFSNGDIIPEAKSDSEWNFAGASGVPAWCYYLNKTSKGSDYGRLYNFFAVSDPRGLCPRGWHVPDDADWNELITQIKPERAGIMLKSTDGWLEGVKGTNESGFNGLPAGYRFYYDGSFKGESATAAWWSSTVDKDGSVLGHYLFHKVGYVDGATYNKKSGLSVRCLRD